MKRKWVITLCVIALVAGITIFDVVRSYGFKINLVSINPNPVTADGQTPVEIKVKLTDNNGVPVEGHNLFAFPRNGGQFKASREKTNKDGTAVFTYFPYKASAVMDVKDVIIDIIDESNSVFIEVNSKTNFIVKVEKGKTDSSDNTDLGNIFGE